jgi:hypothetical protein
MASLAEAALWYAERGLAVFPLKPWSKVPIRGSRGCLDASVQLAQVRRWWSLRPEANIGLATGLLVDVIDIDSEEALEAAARASGWPAPLGVAETPRGRHLYIPSSGQPNRTAMAPGIDYRGRGGYVVAPPSRLAIGSLPYRWLHPLDEEALADERVRLGSDVGAESERPAESGSGGADSGSAGGG